MRSAWYRVPGARNLKIRYKTMSKEIKEIKYLSTNGRSPAVTFREALLKGLAPDAGLYLPDSIPVLTREELIGLKKLKYNELATEIISKFTGSDPARNKLWPLCTDAYDFDIPLENVSGRKYVMRLDRGPTASFKDFAARMMSRLMQHYLAESGKQLTILTATSGDTGSAVASAFSGLENIKVIILFPKNEVSIMQRMQMTTLGGNIKVIAVDGKFDDCQAMVKKAFLDPALSHLPLSSANSINIGRLLPQSVYYFYSWIKLSDGVNEKAVFSVPSGNFGNLTAGLIAARMGLPVKKFIISTNDNDEVPEFLHKGTYKPLIPSKNCISSAMNVGHPSNLARLIAFYGGNMNEKGILTKEPDLDKLRKDFYGVSVSDEQTRKTITEAYNSYRIILEPHGAAAWYGLNDFLNNEKTDGSQIFISLETAHPAKFPEEIEKILGIIPPLPPALSGLSGKKEEYLSIEDNYEMLRDFIYDSNN